MFCCVQLTIIQHWFRWGFGNKPSPESTMIQFTDAFMDQKVSKFSMLKTVYNNYWRKANTSCLSKYVCAQCITTHSQKLQIWWNILIICKQLSITQYGWHTLCHLYCHGICDRRAKIGLIPLHVFPFRFELIVPKALVKWNQFWITQIITSHYIGVSSWSNRYYCYSSYIFVNRRGMWAHNNHTSVNICIPIFSRCDPGWQTHLLSPSQ